MTNNHDPLSELWQRQQVVQTDLSQISKKWQTLRLKQRCYLAVDIISLLIPLLIIWLKFEQLDSYTLGLVFIVMLIGVIAVIYITWLRRFALGWSNEATDQHIKNLQKQIQNNIQIATLSLHSVWIVLILLVVFYGLLYQLNVYPVAQFWQKVHFTLAINALALPAIWIWAKKRKKRFVNELVELKALLAGQ